MDTQLALLQRVNNHSVILCLWTTTGMSRLAGHIVATTRGRGTHRMRPAS